MAEMMENVVIIALPSGLALIAVANKCGGGRLSVVLQLPSYLVELFINAYLVVVSHFLSQT